MYSIDSSPLASVPATTVTSCPRNCCALRDLEDVQGGAADVQPCDHVQDPHRGHRLRSPQATTPSVSQNIAVSGAPPNRAAPASAPRTAASHMAGMYAASGSRRRAATAARQPASASSTASTRGADEAELEEHLVVGLLRDEDAVRGREVVRRLVGEPLARVGEVADELLRWQQPVPAGAEDRLVEEDAASDVGEDQALAPARGVLPGMLRRRPEPRLEKAEIASSERDRAGGGDARDRQRYDRRRPAEIAAATRQDEHDERGEVDADQAREGGAENRPDHADHEPSDREWAWIAAACVDALQPDRGREGREGGEIVLAHERPLSLLIRREEADETPCGRDRREARRRGRAAPAAAAASR